MVSAMGRIGGPLAGHITRLASQPLHALKLADLVR